MKKLLIALTLITVLSSNVALADFKAHFDLGQNYLSNYQYSGAITEFKSALRINYLDSSARIGLINSYLARGREYANKDKEWGKAANDYRSALFYMMYYPDGDAVRNASNEIVQVKNNLERCLDEAGFDRSFKNRYESAKKLRAEGNFAAAAYEFNQSLGTKEYQKNSFEQVGDIFKILGNEPKAAQYYKKAISVAPSDMALRLTYGKILDNIGEEDNAIKEYSYVLERATQDDKDMLYSLERIFSKKIQSSPNNANLQANMGAVLQKQGKLDEALTYYKQAESLDPSNINTRINTGTLYQQKGDYRTAIKAYESVLIIYPNNINANLYRAQCYDKLGENKIAQEGYKKVLTLDPANDYIVGQMVENAKKSMTSTQFANYVRTNLPKANPENIIYDYAIELHKDGKIAEAINMYNESIKTNGNNPEMYVNMALAQAQGKNYDGALTTLNTAKSKFPQDKTVISTLENISSMKTDNLLSQAGDYYNKKDYKNAIATYLSIKPETVDTMMGVATSYQELGDNDNAIEYYKKALTLKPTDSDIAYYIASLYGQKDDFTNAKAYLQKSISINSNNAQAKEFLASIEDMERANSLNDAILLYDSNKYEEALTAFNKILEKEPNNDYALLYRGMIYDSQEKRSEAITDLKKALSLNKEFIICNYLIGTNLDAMEKYKEAITYYEAYANSPDNIDETYKEYAKARAEELRKYVQQTTAKK